MSPSTPSLYFGMNAPSQSEEEKLSRELDDYLAISVMHADQLQDKLLNHQFNFLGGKRKFLYPSIGCLENQ